MKNNFFSYRLRLDRVFLVLCAFIVVAVLLLIVEQRKEIARLKNEVERLEGMILIANEDIELTNSNVTTLFYEINDVKNRVEDIEYYSW